MTATAIFKKSAIGAGLGRIDTAAETRRSPRRRLTRPVLDAFLELAYAQFLLSRALFGLDPK